MDKYQRFLRNISREPLNKRAKRRLMERELKKLYGDNDRTGSDGLDGTLPRRDKGGDVSLGMIKADIVEHGFDTWLEMPPETVIHTYLEVSEEISELVDSFTTMFSQEQDLEDLGIEQNFTLDPTECVTAMRNGMTDIMRSLLHYIDVQRMANSLITEDEE